MKQIVHKKDQCGSPPNSIYVTLISSPETQAAQIEKIYWH
jgi:hypothetical protein